MRWVGLLLMVGWFAACSATEAPAPRRPVSAPVAAVPRGGPPPVAFATGYRLLKNDDAAQARAVLEPIRDYAPLRDYVLFYLGSACARSGATAQALALWTDLDEQYPQSLLADEAALERGRLYRAQGDRERARSAFSVAESAKQRHIAHAARLELADLDLNDGQLNAAATELSSVRRAAPGSVAARKAKAILADLRERHPELRPRGDALDDELDVLMKERDFANAIVIADELLESAPSSDVPALLRRKAEAQNGAGDLRNALATLDEVVARFPRSPAAPLALFRAASLRWNKDFNDDAERSFGQLRRDYPDHSLSADALYALARIAYSGGDSARAQQQFEQFVREYPRHKLAPEARWRMGWISYEAGRWEAAAAAFKRAQQAAADDAVDAQYWQARALERGGNGAAARVAYRGILEAAPASYYAWWAEQRLGEERGPSTIVPPRRRTIGDPPSGVVDEFHLERARALHAGGLSIIAGDELRAFEDDNDGVTGMSRYLVDAYLATNSYRDASRVQRNVGGEDREVTYPLAYWDLLARQTKSTSLDPLLVIALMRQESLYDPRALSPADARGLLQLLPATASATVGHPVTNEQLFDPETNIEIGVAHLRQLLQRYDNDVFKTLAAYNGGPDAVAKWERRFGALERDEFVESITYRETRDYVKKVLSHYRRYQQLYATG